MSNYKPIAAGFALLILMLIIIGGSAVYLLRDIARDVDDIYKHPFAVSNAAKSIDFHLISMHRNMTDVVLAQTPDQRQKAIDEVARHEQEALKNFDIIFDRFLGDELQINRAYNAFIKWKPIRDEVIRLTKAARLREAAEVTNTQGAQHVEKLAKEVDALVKFAFKKAEEFHSRSQENERQALILLTSLILFTVLAALFIAIKVVSSFIKTSKQKAQREHLIDQNIMMASLDLNGNITDISNALCRFLRQLKEDLIGRPSGFFDNSEDAPQTNDYIWQTISTGKNWKGEIKHTNPDGKAHWASSSIIPNFNNEFELIGFTNILTDITSKKLSVTDNLTSLFNRRQYEDIIVREMRLAKRNGVPLTLAIADIDFFKYYNDNYGHPMGDKVLSKVAQQMLESLKRPNDYVFRIGGEEFAFVFSDLDQHDSELFLNEIRLGIEMLAIPHAHSKVNENITISIGAQVVLPNSPTTEDEAYILADKALYMAKEKRNMVVVNS